MGKRGKGTTRKDIATSALTIAGGSKLAAGVRGVIALHRTFQERRLQKLWKFVMRAAENPKQLASRIEVAVLKDGDEVGHAFIAAARSAVDAVDPCTLVSIGELARRFITTQTPSRREYRAYLDLFESLDATEYGMLRNAVHAMRALAGDPIHTRLAEDSATHVWNWFASNSLVEGGPLQGTPLAQGDRAIQLVIALERILEANGKPTLSSRAKPAIPRAVVELLAEIMPQPG